MEIPASSLGARDVYALMTSFIVPRAIALVSTKGRDGATNVAPFSYYTGLGSDPPMITLAISDRRGGAPKDTLRILQDTGVFCVSLVEEPIAAQMNLTSGDHPPGVSEFDVAGLTPAPCTAIDCVQVAEARASMECRLVDVHRYGRRATVNLVVGEVVHWRIDDALLPDGRPVIAPERIRPVARLGGPTYARLGEIFRMERPVVGDQGPTTG